MPRDKTKSHEKIIKAAKKEFLACGYGEASLRRIAAECGLTVSAIYKHFAGKEELFSSLVDPVIELYESVHRRMAKEYFAELEDPDLNHIWEDKGTMTMMMEFIYAHSDEFDLIITKSKGTKYESFIHSMAVMEEETTMRYMDVLKRKGVPVHDVDPDEFHLLVTAEFQALFEAVRHGFDREKAMHYARTLEQFYEPGWKRLFGY